MDTNTLDALQWLSQDEAGTAGLKASLRTTLHATYESQPHLFALDARFATQKFSVEEIVAENLIHIYFRLAPNVQRSSAPNAIAQHPDALLNALWDNVSLVTQATTFTTGITGAPTQVNSSVKGALHSGEGDWSWEVEGLIVCGEILRAWTRARWEDSYAHLFH